MIPEAQRIAIAEACGWTFHDLKYAHIGGGEVFEKFWLPAGVDITTLTADEICRGPNHGRSLPDYLKDLNAMHAAAMHLRDTDRLKYAMYHRELERVVAVANGSEDFGVLTADATAAQRAEAFLRAIGDETKGGGE